jgi:ribonuclease P protein component
LGSERLLRRERLRNRRDFLRCYRSGRRRTRPLLMLYTLPNELGHPRLGITASRKVGPAVVRNRAKRRVRDIFRRFSGRQTLPGVDLVVHLQPSAGVAPFAELSTQLLELLSGVRRDETQGRSAP